MVPSFLVPSGAPGDPSAPGFRELREPREFRELRKLLQLRELRELREIQPLRDRLIGLIPATFNTVILARFACPITWAALG